MDKVRGDYNLIAQDFSSTRREINIWKEARFLLDPKKNDKILDLGCGNGRYYSFFKDEEVKYIGVDNSQELINIAKQKYPGVQFQVESGLNLSFPDNYFDQIYSIAVLHYIPSKEYRLKFLKEAKRVLKNNGYLTLLVWKFPLKEELSLLFKYTILKLLGKTDLDFRDIFRPWHGRTQKYYHLFSKRELKQLVKQAGLRVVDIGVVRNERGNRRNIYIKAQKI